MISSLLAPLAGKLALGVLGLIALGFIVWKIRQAGRDAERAKQLGTTVQSVEKANAAENSVRGANDADLERLRGDWTRK